MFNRTRIKRIVKFIVGLCTAWTVGNIIGNNVTPKNNFRKAEAIVAGTVIGAIVSEHAEEWTGQKVDEIADYFAKEDPPKIYVI